MTNTNLVKVITLRIPNLLKKKLDKYCDKNELSSSQLIRKLLKEKLKRVK